MDNEKLDPKESKCWDCKYGLCMLQENTSFLEANFPMGPPNPMGGMFDQQPEISWEDNEESEDEEPKKIVEHRVCTLCYWAPAGMKLESPIVTGAIVRSCSRYEKKDD